MSVRVFSHATADNNARGNTRDKRPPDFTYLLPRAVNTVPSPAVTFAGILSFFTSRLSCDCIRVLCAIGRLQNKKLPPTLRVNGGFITHRSKLGIRTFSSDAPLPVTRSGPETLPNKSA